MPCRRGAGRRASPRSRRSAALWPRRWRCRVTTGCTVRGSNARVIHNFIPDEIVLDDIPPTAPDAPLLFVGDLSPDKGIQTLLDAYASLDAPPRLVLAGRSTEDWQFPPGADWTGPLPHAEVVDLFRSARAVVVPSVWADPCPTVVLEAMAAGRPVVAAASGGIVDMVVDGLTGRLVPPGDAPALAAALSQVLGDPAAAKAFGEAGRDRAREFTISAVVERIEQMYRDAIARPDVQRADEQRGRQPRRAPAQTRLPAPQRRRAGLHDGGHLRAGLRLLGGGRPVLPGLGRRTGGHRHRRDEPHRTVHRARLRHRADGPAADDAWAARPAGVHRRTGLRRRRRRRRLGLRTGAASRAFSVSPRSGTTPGPPHFSRQVSQPRASA